MEISKEINKLVEIALKGLGYEVEYKVEIPGDSANGDYSTNVSMLLARTLKQNPMEIAEKIVSGVEKPNYIDKIEVARPGFINFYINLKLVIPSILTESLSGNFFKEDNGNVKVIVEHTSVNPNKAMHVGHLRNAILGDTIANVYKKLNYTVEIHNYIDDTGVQVADTTTAVLYLGEQQPADQSFDDYTWDIYSEINRRYETDQALLEKRKEISHLIEQGSNEIAVKAKEIADKIVGCHLDLTNEFNIVYDLLVYESDIIRFGFWNQAFEQLKNSPNFYQETSGDQKGCWVLKYDSEEYGNKIFVRANGTTVYTAKDTAYHLWKFGLLQKDFNYLQWPKQFNSHETWRTDTQGNPKDDFGHGNIIVNVIDERQTYPQEMVKQALRSLGFKEQSENYHHVAYGVVNMSPQTAQKLGVDTSDKKAFYAMSGRKGIGIKARDMLDLMTENVESSKKNSLADSDNSRQIAAGAIKHYMLKYNPNSAIIFDYEQALKISGNTGPYLQYSYTRAVSLLNKAGEFKPNLEKEELTESELELIKLIGQWPETLKSAAETLSISSIAEYAFKVSSSFHSFYEKNAVIKAPEDVKNFRLSVVESFKNVISDVLDVLGIATLERM